MVYFYRCSTAWVARVLVVLLSVDINFTVTVNFQIQKLFCRIYGSFPILNTIPYSIGQQKGTKRHCLGPEIVRVIAIIIVALVMLTLAMKLRKKSGILSQTHTSRLSLKMR